MNMTTNIRQVGDVTIVDIRGRIVLGEESAALRDLVSDLLSKEHRQILFNLAEVNYMCHSGAMWNADRLSASTTASTLPGHGPEVFPHAARKGIREVLWAFSAIELAPSWVRFA